VHQRAAERGQVIRLAAGHLVFGPLVHTTTSSSTQLPPALRMSVCMLGHDVRVRLRTGSASTIVHGPWQITTTGLPASENLVTKCILPRSVAGKARPRTTFG
jgi:hypothetical protein